MQTLVQLHTTLDVFAFFKDVTVVLDAAEMINKWEYAMIVILSGYPAFCRVDKLSYLFNVFIWSSSSPYPGYFNIFYCWIISWISSYFFVILSNIKCITFYLIVTYILWISNIRRIHKWVILFTLFILRMKSFNFYLITMRG